MDTQSPVDPSTSSASLPTTRGYQQEMLEESLTKNLIIALDTGSGKTHIAVLRMKIEAERESKKVKFGCCINVAQYIHNIVAGFLVLRAYRCIVRTAKISDIASPSGFSGTDIWCP
jgi:hypothetical protein